MIPIVTCILLLTQLHAQNVGEDSVYASERVRAIVTRAAARNAAPPATLAGYRARVETDLSFVQSQADGRETLLQLEQLASNVYWRADGAMTQEIVGYRAQALGAAFSGLSFFEVPFIVPTLYADRLDLVRTTGPVRAASGHVQQRRTLHPFAPTREAVYSFSGGDTVNVIQLPKRTIAIVRIHVTPRRQPSRPTLLFEGDIDLDADRDHIVRMQGRLIATGRGPSLLRSVIQGVLYVKLENAEYDERYWLPREQRFEAQAITRVGDVRTTFRAVSRVVDLITNDSAAVARAADVDSFPYGRLTIGKMRNMSRFNDWTNQIGTISRTTDAHDFDAYAPPSMQPRNQARLTFGARYGSQLLRFNPVEGMFAGPGLSYRISDRLHAGAYGGYAWSEHAVRGGAEVADATPAWETRVRVERQLAHKADFVDVLPPEPDIAPVFAGNQYDFLDRRIASAIVRQRSHIGMIARFEVGRASDRNVMRHVLNTRDSLSLTGHADAGSYWLARAQLQNNAPGGAQSLVPGFGWQLRYEGAQGDLHWQRIEAGATLRRMAKSFTFDLRADAGTVFSSATPAQTLFDFHNSATLPGYVGERVFAGDRAALGRATVIYSLPFLRSPVRVGPLFLPALAPSPAIGFYGAWTDARTQTRTVLDRVHWQTTNGLRSSIDLRMRFLSGAVNAGAARPLEHGGKWKFVWQWVADL